MTPQIPFIKIEDRKLGDEWDTWQGVVGEDVQNANAGKRIFFGVLLLTIFLMGFTALVTWYMTAPRLAQFYTYLPRIVAALFILLWLFTALWFISMVMAVWLEKRILVNVFGKEFSVTFIVPLVVKLGMRLGISRDRLGNSFVKISNSLIKSQAHPISPENLLILLPRCLKKNIIDTVTELSHQLNIMVYTVGGGSKALEIIRKRKPQAIIGVACERDLLAGIQEVITHIPVMGIPNIRPEGPCKNTEIDMKDLKMAIETFIGHSIPLT